VQQRLRALRQNEDGFTLTELLIVIIILGVLAGIVVFAVNGITDRGEKSACKADVKTVQVASEAYYANNTGWAADMDALVTAGLLQAKPNSPKYTIAYDKNTGGVTGTLAGGGAC
jgi:general secretion pathway protein G